MTGRTLPLLRKASLSASFIAMLPMLASCATTVPDSGNLAVWADRPDTAEALYLKRIEQITEARGRIDYDIIGQVPGAANPMPLPRSTETQINSDALNSATQYAQDNNSSALLVWHGNAIVSESYFGETQADTLLPTKSLSKPLSAIAIGRAIMLGQITDLDQPVADYITEWQGTDKQSMTIRDALLMQSGLLEQAFGIDPNGPLMRAYLDPYHDQYIVEHYPLTDAPGTRFAYSNASADLIAIIIERASGKSYRQFIGEDVLAPIGAAGGEAWLNRPDGNAHSGCCMFFPAETILKYARLLMDDGRAEGQQILPDGFVNEMRAPSTHNPHYGLGIWLGSPYLERRGFLGLESDAPKVLHSEPFLADDVFMFDGSGSQIVYIVPSHDMIVLRTGNNPTGEQEWDNSFLINTILSGLPVKP